MSYMHFDVRYRDLERASVEYAARVAVFNKLLDKEVENTVKNMAQKSHDLAPVLYYVLAPDIRDRREKIGHAHHRYGTNVAYGRRWEYEHRTKSGYFGKVYRSEPPALNNRISKLILKAFTL